MIYRASEEDRIYAHQNPVMMPPLRIYYAVRTPPKDPQQEFALENRLVVDYAGGGFGKNLPIEDRERID